MSPYGALEFFARTRAPNEPLCFFFSVFAPVSFFQLLAPFYFYDFWSLDLFFGRMCLRLLGKLDRCTASFGGTNVDHLRDNSADSIFLSAGEIFLTRVPQIPEASCDNPRGALFEDKHIDGAGGMLHLGLSLFTKRLLKVWPVGQPTVGYMQQPGSFWLTNSAAFEHQAVHVQPVASTDVFRFGDLDDLSCSVMMRSCFFPHDRARNANSIVTPQAAFQACTKCIAGWIKEQGSQLELPTLQELEEALARD